jgi:predicted AAA+ superfamily ATPase
VPLATESERQRNSNPRKLYPVDPGLIRAYDTSGLSNLGHALETAVLNEIERRRGEVAYVKTAEGFEVDFHVRHLSGAEELVQVCVDPAGALDRELRALAEAAPAAPRAIRRLLVLTRDQAIPIVEPGVIVQPAYEWLLAEAD